MRNLNYTFVYLMLFIRLVKAGARGDFFLNICRSIADFGQAYADSFGPIKITIFRYVCR